MEEQHHTANWGLEDGLKHLDGESVRLRYLHIKWAGATTSSNIEKGLTHLHNGATQAKAAGGLKLRYVRRIFSNNKFILPS